MWMVKASTAVNGSSPVSVLQSPPNMGLAIVAAWSAITVFLK